MQVDVWGFGNWCLMRRKAFLTAAVFWTWNETGTGAETQIVIVNEHQLADGSQIVTVAMQILKKTADFLVMGIVIWMVTSSRCVWKEGGVFCCEVTGFLSVKCYSFDDAYASHDVPCEYQCLYQLNRLRNCLTLGAVVYRPSLCDSLVLRTQIGTESGNAYVDVVMGIENDV